MPVIQRLKLWLLLLGLSVTVVSCSDDQVIIDPGVNRGDEVITRDVVLMKLPPAIIAFSQINGEAWSRDREAIIARWDDQITVKTVVIQPGSRADAFAVSAGTYRAAVIFTRPGPNTPAIKRTLRLN